MAPPVTQLRTQDIWVTGYAAYAVFFLRSAHRFFIISDIRFRAAGLIFRRPPDCFGEADLAVCLRLSAHLAFAASDIRLRPAALIRRRRGFGPSALETAAVGTPVSLNVSRAAMA